MINNHTRFLCLATLLLAGACSSQSHGPAQSAAAELTGTSWQLVRFQGSDDKSLTPDDRTKYTISFEASDQLTTRIDCNRGRGTWKSSRPNELQFGPLALTRAMCAPGSLHDRIVKDWEFVRSYTIKDGLLFLALMADGGIYELESIGAAKSVAANSPVASTGPIEFECRQTGGGVETVRATFYQTTPGLVLVERRDSTRPAFQTPAASGAKYEGRELLFWDARGEAMVNWSGTEMKCKPRKQ